MVDSHSPVGGTIMVYMAALAECPALVECLAMVGLNSGFGIDLYLNRVTGVNLLLNPGHSPMWSTTHQSKMVQVMRRKPSLLAMGLMPQGMGMTPPGMGMTLPGMGMTPPGIGM